MAKRDPKYWECYVKSCSGVNPYSRSVHRKKGSMKRLAKIFKKYGRPKQTSASCLYVEGLEIPVAEAMARDLKAANFFPCVVYYKKGNR